MTGLTISALTVQYGKAFAVRSVDLIVPDGGIVGIAGRNGAGKSSTLRAISALVPHGGMVTLDGRALARNPSVVARSGVSHVPEGRGLIGVMTVLDNLRLACAGVRKPETAIDELLDEEPAFDALRPLFQRKAGYLSGGEQQLLAVARGLVASPRFLLIDELSLGLSPVALGLVLKAVLKACQEKKIGLLLVDQNVHLLKRVCDSVYLMNEGTLKDAAALSDRDIDRVYLT